MIDTAEASPEQSPLALSAVEAARAPWADMQRTHPFTLAHRLIASVPTLIYALLPILLARGSNFASYFTLIAFVGFGVLGIPFIIAGWMRLTFRVDPDAVVIESGVFSRQFRNIPIERIQRIEVEQPALARAFGMARVLIMTGSGAGAEGTLAFIPHTRALALRKLLRALEQQHERSAAPIDADQPDAAHDEEAETTLFQMPLRSVLGAGAMRFSLVYIAIAFGIVQNLQIDPEDVVDFFSDERYSDYTSSLPDSVALTVALTVCIAFLLSWLFGILTTLNSLYGFRLGRESGKLVTSQGLLSKTQRTIPIARVQALRIRTNPVHRLLGFAQFHAQTMGLDDSSNGLAQLVPLAQAPVSDDLAHEYFGVTRPGIVRHVSELFIRRRVMRVLFGVLIPVAIAYAISRSHHAFWALLLIPPLIAWVRGIWNAHGYALDRGVLVVQAGAIIRRFRYLPTHKIQSVELERSFFQRRRGLASVAIDTAGAQHAFMPRIHDLLLPDAQSLIARLEPLMLRRRPAGLWQEPIAVEVAAQSDKPQVENGGDGLAVGGALQAERGPADGERPRQRPDDTRPPGQAGDESSEERPGDTLADVARDRAEDDVADQPLDDDDVERLDQDGQREDRSRPG